MPRTSPHAERRAELDRRLADVLATADETSLELARAGVQSAPDRWYGQLLALAHDAVAGEESAAEQSAAEQSAAEQSATEQSADGSAASRADVVLPAATAVELLRGYCRLRGELFAGLGNGVANSLPRDPSAALLAGDYLNSAAYAVLGSVDHPRLGDAVETLLSVSESIACAFDARGDRADDPGSFLDETAGSVGRGAAVIGATLAGAEAATRERFATVGSGFSTARQVQRHLDPDAETLAIAPPQPDADRLREHGARRLDAASRALDDLAPTADVATLRTFVEDTLTAFDPTA